MFSSYSILFLFLFRIKLTNTPDGVIKLEIAHAQPSDCGAYKLVVANPHGESAALCAVAVKRKITLNNFILNSFSTYLIRIFS